VILFFVADHRLDRVPSFETLLQRSSGFVPGGDVDFDVFRVMLFASVAAINKCFLGSGAGQALGLIDRILERRPVIEIAVMRLDADDPTRLKLWRNLTEVFYGCFLAIFLDVILAKYGVFIAFYTFPKTSNAFLNITMDVQRLN